MKKSVSYFLSHPIQYYTPLLQEMAKQFDLSVYYFSDASIRGNVDRDFGRPVQWDIPLLEGYSSQFIKNYSWRKSLSNRFADLINPGVFSVLMKDNSSVVIVNGWMYCSVLFTIFFAKLRGKQVWLRADNAYHQEIRKSRKLLAVKRMILHYGLFPFVDKFLFTGVESRLFFEYYGAKKNQLLFTPHAVDNTYFRSRFSALKAERNTLREELGFSREMVVILFVGKFIKKKRPMDLLRAFQGLPSGKVGLVMVGEGVLRKEMERFCDEQQMGNVRIVGFVNQSAISGYYSIADIFVLCSGMGETWGLVVNEAMNFELPVVVTETCGCARDLVVDGENGFVCPEGDIAQLRGALRKLAADEVFRTRAGKRSAAQIEAYTVEQIVKNMAGFGWTK